MPLWNLQSNVGETLNTQLQIVLMCYEGKILKIFTGMSRKASLIYKGDTVVIT